MVDGAVDGLTGVPSLQVASFPLFTLWSLVSMAGRVKTSGVSHRLSSHKRLRSFSVHIDNAQEVQDIVILSIERTMLCNWSS